MLNFAFLFTINYRWLTHDQAATALRRSLNAVLVSLDREASERENPTADGCLRKMKTYKFIATLHLLCDTLPHLSRLSKLFQRQEINLAHVEPMVTATLNAVRNLQQERGPHLKKVDELLRTVLREHNISATDHQRAEFDRSIRQKFLKTLEDHIVSRFPNNSIITALSVFDPQNMPEEFVLYGEDEIELLGDHFGGADDLLTEWIQFRELMKSSYQSCTLAQLAENLYKGKPPVAESFPKVAKLISIAVMIPVSTADCERGFSAMNSIKTELRNRMKAATLDRLVRIAIDGPQRKDFDFVTAAKSWIAIRNRRLFNNQRSD